MKLAGFTGTALSDDFGVFIDKYRHDWFFSLVLGGFNHTGGRFGHRIGANNGQTGFG